MQTGTQYNVMVGSDSSVFFLKENKTKDGKILTQTKDADGLVIQEYPVLERRTGHSIKGTTESIESAEIRKGRTKSAPRKGNSSSDGSLDIELSPASYDDIFEAALRGSWEEWKSDYNDKFVLKGANVSFTEGDGNFLMKSGSDTYSAKKLISSTDNDKPLIKISKGDYEVHQLKVGTEAHKFGAIVKYDGPDGALYQDFQHLAVNTMSLTVSPGQIVTGSFGFMGSNDPKLEGAGYAKLAKDETFKDGTTYYKKNNQTGKFETATVTSARFDSLKKDLYIFDNSDNSENFVKTIGSRFESAPSDVREWVENLNDITENTKDQFTAREGFLYVNGQVVDFGSNLTFELNNGLKQLYAIFRPDAVANPAMTLDVTGTLDTYLIKDHSEDLFNYAVKDEDVELVWAFQDKETDPEDIYVFQIFKSKFDKDISSGSEELTMSLPYTSFEERAVRIFRIRKKTVKSIVANSRTNDSGVDEIDYKYGVKVNLAATTIGGSAPQTVGTDAISCKIYSKGSTSAVEGLTGTYSSGVYIYTYSDGSSALNTGDYYVVVTYNGCTYKKYFTVN